MASVRSLFCHGFRGSFSTAGIGAPMVRRMASSGISDMQPVRFGPGGDIPGYVVGDKGKSAVILIQEWWGVTDGIKEKAVKIADAGKYRVLVPDLYKGKVGVDVEEANHMMSNLDFPNAVKEIDEAAKFLTEEGSGKVGIAGFCMGGALTMGGLAGSSHIVCGAPFYGVNFGLFDVSTLKKPVQGHFGELDNMAGFSDADTGRKLEADLKAAGNQDAEVFIYPKVGHAFMNDSPSPFPTFEARKEAMGEGFPPYDAATADLAWSRLFAFFGKHL
eukprot:TRINITY_DN41517_c0_g1_i1.p1 TRINITY_DN41517_c0_g1~~TRINITY_DN41517_c0_g1_i1.p1  ORF type:complete len:305 (+),score=64.26 TRINITY_DN41517_c0_g1_i1:96-917(+)